MLPAVRSRGTPVGRRLWAGPRVLSAMMVLPAALLRGPRGPPLDAAVVLGPGSGWAVGSPQPALVAGGADREGAPVLARGCPAPVPWVAPALPAGVLGLAVPLSIWEPPGQSDPRGNQSMAERGGAGGEPGCSVHPGQGLCQPRPHGPRSLHIPAPAETTPASTAGGDLCCHGSSIRAESGTSQYPKGQISQQGWAHRTSQPYTLSRCALCLGFAPPHPLPSLPSPLPSPVSLCPTCAAHHVGGASGPVGCAAPRAPRSLCG